MYNVKTPRNIVINTGSGLIGIDETLKLVKELEMNVFCMVLWLYSTSRLFLVEIARATSRSLSRYRRSGSTRTPKPSHKTLRVKCSTWLETWNDKFDKHEWSPIATPPTVRFLKFARFGFSLFRNDNSRTTDASTTNSTRARTKALTAVQSSRATRLDKQQGPAQAQAADEPVLLDE